MERCNGPAAKPRKVLFAGGGPAGMKAATVAAERGELHVIGDCRAPRSAAEAVLEGLKVASAL
ncbi:MAG: hypothetical protein ACE5H8_15780 [Alphaproteobacteria bacterium]